MTVHRFIFDLRPIPKILAVLKSENETLSTLAEEARCKAKTILGSVPNERVLPTPGVQADLEELKSLVSLSLEDQLFKKVEATKDLMSLVEALRQYFVSLRKFRKFDQEELAVWEDMNRLLENIKEGCEFRCDSIIEGIEEYTREKISRMK